MEKIQTLFAPKPVGPYSQAIKVGKLIYTSGQIGINPVDGILEEGIENQTERVCKNLYEVLKETGCDYSDTIKTTIFLADINDYGKVNEIYAKYFSHGPARSCVQVAAIPAGALVEIELIAKL